MFFRTPIYTFSNQIFVRTICTFFFEISLICLGYFLKITFFDVEILKRCISIGFWARKLGKVSFNTVISMYKLVMGDIDISIGNIDLQVGDGWYWCINWWFCCTNQWWVILMYQSVMLIYQSMILIYKLVILTWQGGCLLKSKREENGEKKKRKGKACIL